MATITPTVSKKNEGKYNWGLGRRKTATARVRLCAGSGKITVNGRPAEQYFPTPDSQGPLKLAFNATGTEGKFDVFVNVDGGGVVAQADAVRLGIARALVKVNAEFDQKLKEADLMTRDSRMKERKKYGLRGARKGTQFSKR